MTNTWEDTHYPCRICLKEGKKVKAVGCFSPDLDIQGLCFCKKHMEDGFMEYYNLIHKK